MRKKEEDMNHGFFWQMFTTWQPKKNSWQIQQRDFWDLKTHVPHPICFYWQVESFSVRINASWIQETSVPILHVYGNSCSQGLLPIPGPTSWNDPYEELFFNTCTACVDCFDNVNKGEKEKPLSRPIFRLWCTSETYPQERSRIIGLPGKALCFTWLSPVY